MFAQRRQSFRTAMGPGGVAIILGAGLVTRSRDTEFPFRQESNFHYLTGFDHPHAIAVLRTDDGPAYSLYVEPRDRSMEIWTGFRPGVEGALSDHGADCAKTNVEFLADLPDLVSGAERIFHVLGRDTKVDAKITECLEALHLRSRQGQDAPDQIVDPRSILHEMRLFKEPEELDIMRRAADITREAHCDAARRMCNVENEYELQAIIEFAFRRRGASGPSYSTIVGGGANATVLHYVKNDCPLRPGEVVLIDAGCELEGYASDVTRTFPIGGRFEGPQRALYDVVLNAQLAGIEASQPKSTLGEIHELTVRRLVEGLVDLGLLEGGVDERVDDESYRRFYMHNTSHWLGLDVHDVGSYRKSGEHRPLEPGMVFTVEPGLYVASDDEQADPRFRGIGVRIEDDLAILEAGHENLTAAIPKNPDALIELANQGR